MNFWNKVIFLDESKLNVFGSNEIVRRKLNRFKLRVRFKKSKMCYKIAR